jgi:predicted TIM-barrel fold metal-dependent hydrolase
MITSSQTKPVDMHVHIVGNGTGGTGCTMRVDFWHTPLARFMLRHIGLPQSALKGDLDTLFVAKLLEMMHGSSLGAAVILAHEKVYRDDGGEIENFGSMYIPNDYVLTLAEKHPEFLPAVSIHPARPDALEELERCLTRGTVMLKILPNCQNINCSDPRYKKFWERMAEAKLPLLAHTGGEHTVPVVERKYSDPRTLKLPLEIGVNVIAAHCATKSGLFDAEYFHAFAEMTRQYPNLYGDTSAFNVPIRGQHMNACLQEPLASHLVHGSDFPVPVYGFWAWRRGQLDWKTSRKWDSHANVLERDYQLKRAIGFPEEHFTRVWKLLRLTKSH